MWSMRQAYITTCMLSILDTQFQMYLSIWLSFKSYTITLPLARHSIRSGLAYYVSIHGWSWINNTRYYTMRDFPQWERRLGLLEANMQYVQYLPCLQLVTMIEIKIYSYRVCSSTSYGRMASPRSKHIPIESGWWQVTIPTWMSRNYWTSGYPCHNGIDQI